MKEGLNEARQHHIQWWKQNGIVCGTAKPMPVQGKTVPAIDPVHMYREPDTGAEQLHRIMEASTFPGDSIPTVNTNIGPGSLAVYLGSAPDFSNDTVWFSQAYDTKEDFPELRFDPENLWWKRTERLIGRCRELSGTRYAVGIPDLVENWDILASLRGTENLLMDMIEDPEWVKRKISEIHTVYFEIYDRLYALVRDEDGGCAFRAFMLWAPGRTAKLQCDGSAMFSPAMFEEFVIPSLSEQARRIEYSMYHLDGTQCIPHLDQLLRIEALRAVEWTPQAGIEQGTSERWYQMYRKILSAGKSLQVLVENPAEVPALLDAIGTDGIYLLYTGENPDDFQVLLESVSRYRS